MIVNDQETNTSFELGPSEEEQNEADRLHREELKEQESHFDAQL